MAKKMLYEGKTRVQINREIKKQMRRAALTPVERKLRRALLRRETGIHMTRAEISLITSAARLGAR
jgi:hypothetical protein